MEFRRTHYRTCPTRKKGNHHGHPCFKAIGCWTGSRSRNWTDLYRWCFIRNTLWENRYIYAGGMVGIWWYKSRSLYQYQWRIRKRNGNGSYIQGTGAVPYWSECDDGIQPEYPWSDGTSGSGLGICLGQNGWRRACTHRCKLGLHILSTWRKHGCNNTDCNSHFPCIGNLYRLSDYLQHISDFRYRGYSILWLAENHWCYAPATETYYPPAGTVFVHCRHSRRIIIGIWCRCNSDASRNGTNHFWCRRFHRQHFTVDFLCVCSVCANYSFAVLLPSG